MQSFVVAECCVYDVTLATDGGTVWVGWYANGSSSIGQGTFVRQLYPTLGPVIQAPGSVASFGGSPGSLGTDQGVALTARVGGGVYLAYLTGYPTAKAVAFWRVGASGFKKVPDSKGAETASLSTTGTGALWIGFDDADGHVRALRTSSNAAAFGAVQDLKSPKKSDVIYGLGIAAGGGRADVVLNDGTSFWHQQVNPGLSISASPEQWNGNSSKTVTFKVGDANDEREGREGQGRWQVLHDQQEGHLQHQLRGAQPGQDQGDGEEERLRAGQGVPEGQLTRSTSLPVARRSSRSARARATSSRAYVAPMGGSRTPLSSQGSRASHWRRRKPWWL